MLRFQPKDVTLAYAARGGDLRGAKTVKDELASVATLWRLWLLRRATVTSTSRAAGHRRLPTLNTAPANDLTAPHQPSEDSHKELVVQDRIAFDALPFLERESREWLRHDRGEIHVRSRREYFLGDNPLPPLPARSRESSRPFRKGKSKDLRG